MNFWLETETFQLRGQMMQVTVLSLHERTNINTQIQNNF